MNARWRNLFWPHSREGQQFAIAALILAAMSGFTLASQTTLFSIVLSTATWSIAMYVQVVIWRFAYLAIVGRQGEPNRVAAIVVALLILGGWSSAYRSSLGQRQHVLAPAVEAPTESVTLSASFSARVKSIEDRRKQRAYASWDSYQDDLIGVFVEMTPRDQFIFMTQFFAERRVSVRYEALTSTQETAMRRDLDKLEQALRRFQKPY